MKDLNESRKYCDLIDLYGNLLTERQSDIIKAYYFDDLSLSEIGENFGIDRQTVKTTLRRTENLLIGYEEKLNLLEKFAKIALIADKISQNDDDNGKQDSDYLDEIIKIIRQ